MYFAAIFKLSVLPCFLIVKTLQFPSPQITNL